MKPCRAWIVLGLLALVGCAGPALRSQSPEEFTSDIESTTKLVGDVARAYGDDYVQVEAVGMVTGLNGTGEDPPPSPQRAMLLHEMQMRGVENPNQVLASPANAMVLVRGYLPPGAQKGDNFDLEVQVPSRSGTTSLRGGWLMESRLTELAVLGEQIRDGHLLALGTGSVLVDPSASTESNPTALTTGRVLGGGTVLHSRSLGLVLNPNERSVPLSARIGEAVNHRFHHFDHGIKQGVSTPKTDEFIVLEVHPRYKDNISRYMRVVRSLAIKESNTQQFERLQLLERQLADPLTAATAALRLEAIGKPAIPTLVKAIGSGDPEVRCYSAEALAYLDDTRAAPVLAQAATDEPAFRAFALAALSAMDDGGAYDELRKLLDVSSAETRYGAFRALWAMNPNDAVIKGESLGGFNYHVLSTAGPPMIHLTRSFRPEIVVFGHEQTLRTPLSIEGGNNILINAGEGEKITVSRFAVGQADQKRVVSNKVDDVIRAIVELGGTYPDVVLALQQAKTAHALSGRLEVDAIPNGNRKYRRKESGDSEGDENESRGQIEVANPVPELFSTKRVRR
ncbi:MAG TPA: flagellar basal body P-ring protein FlgI [Pirellulales bacterium]|nr:flagellar basal body P-ring protein FlgI [Pirellulales bacterium]